MIVVSEPYIVKENDIDGNGHMHYTKYADLFSRGRSQLMEVYELRDECASEGRRGMIVSDFRMQYPQEVKVGASLKVHSSFQYKRGINLIIRQIIMHERKIVTRALTETFFAIRCDGKLKPIRPPTDLVEKLINT